MATPDVKAALRAFTSFPAVKQVYSEGEIKSSVLVEYAAYTGGTRLLQVDLEILDPGSWGAGLQYFTGSKDHNVHLRGMAVDRGLKLNEYGLFRGEEKLAGATEEEVYKGLGLPWIPPELREDRGEIEAALRGELPQLVELGDIRGDLQMHTVASDGKNSIEEMAHAAKRLGYEYIALTDHSKAVTVANGLDEKRTLAQIDKIQAG